MAINKEAYLCLSAMLRARETRMLSADKAARMLEAAGVEECAKLLADGGYEDLSGLSAAEIDAALSARRAALFAEVEQLAPDKALVTLFRLKYDYHNAKAVLKAEAMGSDPLRLMSASGRVAPEKLKSTYDEERMADLPGVLGAAMVEAGATLARTANPQLADFELDRAYFAEMKATAESLDNRFVNGYVSLLIDAANLKATVRTARMHKSASFLSDALIRGGTDIDQIVNADGETLAALFAHTPLEKAAVAGAEAMHGGSMTDFERESDNAVNAYIRASKLIAYGPEVVVSYLAAVENEITAVRMILTGMLAGVPSGTIRERLRELYV